MGSIKGQITNPADRLCADDLSRQNCNKDVSLGEPVAPGKSEKASLG